MLRRLFRSLRPSPLRVVYDDSYDRPLPGTPMDPARAANILAFLLDRGILKPREVVRPRPAAIADLARAHTAGYLEGIQADPAVLEAVFGFRLAPPEAERMIALQRLMAGGTTAAAHLAIRGRRPVLHLGGGLHHAGPDRGAGFCIFNDVVVAVRHQRARGFRAPVLVVDLDIHHGNGTRAAFAADESVHTFSIHNQPWDEGPAVASTDIVLGSGAEDLVFLRAVREALPPLLAGVRPGLVIYLAGTDPAADDLLGDWHITSAGMLARDQFVATAVREACGPRTPFVILLAGGYGFNAWRYTARFAGWLGLGSVVEPPDDMELTVRRFRHAVRAVDPAQGARDNWGLTAEDLFGADPAGGGERKILGQFTSHGFELLLDRVGILERLRALGYPTPTMDVDYGSGLGQTIRVFGEAERRTLLIELRIRRDRSLLPGLELLFVEWLLLQNPRAEFSERQPPLPGQRYPGLGLLGTVVGLLVLVCERLGLDGVADVPAHYPIAAIGRKHLRFLDPARQGRFEALLEVLKGYRVAEADRLLGEGRVVDDATGAVVRWEPAPMVIPVSDRLRARMDGAEYGAAAENVRGSVHLRVADGAEDSLRP